MNTTQKLITGFLTLVILTTTVYILLPDQVKITVGNTYTTLQVYENKIWTTAGQEYSILYNGTKKLNANYRNITTITEGNKTTIIRYANFTGDTQVIDTYLFDGSTKDVELYPISHKIQVINGEGKILVYEVTKLGYTRETKNEITSPQIFLHNTKVTWEEGNYYSKILKLINKDEGKLTIKYKIDSNDYSKEVRLFDPILTNKQLSTSITEETPEFLKADFNEKYGYISLEREDKVKLAEYSLIETSESIINLEVRGKAILYTNGKLFDDANFKNIQGELVNAKDVQYYISINKSYTEKEVTSYKEICEEVKLTEEDIKNGTKSYKNCYQVPDGYKDVTKYRSEWIVYNYEDLKAGNYEWKIDFKRNINQQIDFIPKAQGKDLTDWVWFNNSWLYKKQISNLTGNFSYMNISYNAHMQTDFDDLRFIDNATESIELNYTIETKSNSHWAIVRLNNLGAGAIYMYYGNSNLTTTSSSYNTHFKPVAYYYLDEASGVAIDSIYGNNGTVGAGITQNQPGSISKAIKGDNGATATINAQDQSYLDGGAELSLSFDWNGSTTSSLEDILLKGTDSSTTRNYEVRIQDGYIDFIFYSSGYKEYKTSSAVLTANTWNHVVITYNDANNNVSIYVNKVLVQSFSTTYSMVANSETLKLCGDVNVYTCKSNIDEMIIWNKTLTPVEAKAISNYTTPIYVLGDEQGTKMDREVNYTIIPSLGIIRFTNCSPDFENSDSRPEGELTNVFCYQESMNTSNQTGVDGNCGLNYTGTIANYGWGSIGYIYINYTKPVNAVGATWNTVFGNSSIDKYNENNTVPSDCFSADATKLRLRFRDSYELNSYSQSYGQCYNGTWKTITSVSTITPSSYEDLSWAINNQGEIIPKINDGDLNTGGFQWIGGVNSYSVATLTAGNSYAFIYEDSIYWSIPTSLGSINLTNNWTEAVDIKLNLTGNLNTGWTIFASNDSLANNVTLETGTPKTLFSGVAVNESKVIWLKANCSYVSSNPGQSINIWAY